jgi:4-amino-4-deoxy-L-arabinose transferase-like glycosyltransferase
MPDPADLNAGRRTNAVVGALVVVAVYLLASRLTNRVGGFAAGFFLSLQPLHLRLSSQALSDELLALLLTLSFLAAWRFARVPSLANGCLLGALLGLGGATKLSPLLLSLPLAAYGALWLVITLRQRGRVGIRWPQGRFGWLLLAQPLIGGAIFVAVNPYLWPDPIRRTWEQFDFRRDEMDSQSSAWPIAAVENPLVAFERTGRRFNTDYSTSIRIQEWFAQTVSVDFKPIPLDVMFMAAGMVALLAIVVRRGLWSPHALVAYLMAASSAVVIVGMGVDFYRYFLPLLVVASICVGVGIGAGFSLLANTRASRVKAANRPPRASSRVRSRHRSTIST